ncbi:MAG: sensor histidine kinase [Candidatus Glassbacteria bacterium]
MKKNRNQKNPGGSTKPDPRPYSPLETKVELARDIYTIRATIYNPELILDENWRIIGYSNSFLLLTDSVIGFAQRRDSLEDFLEAGDFEKIREYQETVSALEILNYDVGEQWELRYRGPGSEDEIGSTWLCAAGEDPDLWRIEKSGGSHRLVHRARLEDARDCYAMYHRGFARGDQDIKIGYKISTSAVKDHISDLSAVINGSPGGISHYPDISGYTVCTGSNNNTLARLQRLGVDIVSMTEALEPETEYEIVAERTGGSVTRRMKNLNNGRWTPTLKMVDPHAVYDINDNFGFTTYSGDLVVYDIEVYIRPSRFSIDQFKLPFDTDVRLRDERLAGRLFRLKLGRDVRANRSLNRLMFEDITERRHMEDELKKSHEQLRELALHLQMVREQERRQIAREIHDELGQTLTALQLDLHGMKKRLPADLTALRDKTDSMLGLIDITNRAVQRISTHLRPALLDDLGLTAAIEWQVGEFQDRTGIECELNLEAEEASLAEDLATAIFRIFQETLTNIARHAEASRAWVNLIAIDGRLVLEVRDNGRGITQSQIDNPQSFGLIGMRERLYPWGGEVGITGEPGRGTTVRVSVSLEREVRENDQNTDRR